MFSMVNINEWICEFLILLMILSELSASVYEIDLAEIGVVCPSYMGNYTECHFLGRIHKFKTTLWKANTNLIVGFLVWPKYSFQELVCKN